MGFQLIIRFTLVLLSVNGKKSGIGHTGEQTGIIVDLRVLGIKLKSNLQSDLK